MAHSQVSAVASSSAPTGVRIAFVSCPVLDHARSALTVYDNRYTQSLRPGTDRAARARLTLNLQRQCWRHGNRLAPERKLQKETAGSLISVSYRSPLSSINP